MKIVLATGNKKKVEEIQRIVKDQGVALHTLKEFPDCPEVIEDGNTFQANAEKKALEIAQHTDMMALADDSGLVVDGLDGAPGVFSARFAGPAATDQNNLQKLLTDLAERPDAARSARFVCVMVLADAQGRMRSYTGSVEGRIIDEARGENGFGYDPVFVPETHRDDDRTFAEMESGQKDALSHRGRALAQFAEAIRRHGASILTS